MNTGLFVMPLKAGKKEAYQQFLQECLTDKRDEYHALLSRYKLNNVKIWLHTLAGIDYAMFTHDMSEGADERLQHWPDSSNTFEVWFDNQLKACYDFDGLENMPQQPFFVGQLN